MQLRRQLVELEKEAEKLGLMEESVKNVEKSVKNVAESVKNVEQLKNGSKLKNDLDKIEPKETPNGTNKILNAS